MSVVSPWIWLAMVRRPWVWRVVYRTSCAEPIGVANRSVDVPPVSSVSNAAMCKRLLTGEGMEIAIGVGEGIVERADRRYRHSDGA